MFSEDLRKVGLSGGHNLFITPKFPRRVIITFPVDSIVFFFFRADSPQVWLTRSFVMSTVSAISRSSRQMREDTSYPDAVRTKLEFRFGSNFAGSLYESVNFYCDTGAIGRGGQVIIISLLSMLINPTGLATKTILLINLNSL